MNLFSISGLSVGISCIILAVITIIFGKTKLHRQLLFFNIVVAVWGIGLYIVGISDTGPEAIFGWKFAHVGGFFIGPFYYHLVHVLTDIKHRKLLYFGYLQAVVIIMIGLTTEYVFNKTRFVFGIHFIEMNFYYFWGFAFYVFLVLLSFYELFRYLPETYGYKRTKTLYIIFGFMIGFLGGSTTFLPMFGLDLFYPFGNFGITLYVIILGYAILRHRVMDIHLVFKKSLVYSLSAGILTGIFIFLVLALTEALSEIIGVSSFTIMVMSALVIAFLFNPIKNRIQLIINKVFYKTTYDYYNVIQKISHEFASTIDLKHVYEIIIEAVFITLKLESVYLLSAEGKNFELLYYRLSKDKTRNENIISIQKTVSESQLAGFLKENKKICFKDELLENTGQDKADIIMEELKSFNGEVIAPIFIDNKLTYLLLFGKKLSDDIFTEEDISLLRTITNQAEIALKNARLYNELEKRVEEKTQELRAFQTQLIQSEKLSAIGELAAGLAHELNSPLAGLLSLIKKYRTEADKDSKQYRHMTLMFNACEHMDKIIQDFNAFSRKSKGEISEVNLHEVIESTLSLTVSKLKEKDIQLTKKYTDGQPVIKGNKNELQQVFLNIIMNAIDAMDKKGTLVIETGISGDGKKFTIKIVDNGCGINKENIGRIFDPFFTTKAYGKGVGLGLSVSYGIIKDYGGEIEVESEPGKGSEFTLFFPAAGQL